LKHLVQSELLIFRERRRKNCQKAGTIFFNSPALFSNLFHFGVQAEAWLMTNNEYRK